MIDAFTFYFYFCQRIMQNYQGCLLAVDSPWMLKLSEISGLSSHLNSRLLRSGLLSRGRIDLLTFKEENYGRKKVLTGHFNSPKSLYLLIFSSTWARSEGIGFLAVISDSQLCDLYS